MPVVRSGTFVIKGLRVDTIGTDWFFNPTSGSQTWYNTLLGPPVPTNYVAGVTGASLLDTSTEGLNLPINPSPAGFQASTNVRVNVAVSGFVLGPGGSSGDVQYSSVFFVLGDPDPDANKFDDYPSYISLLSFIRVRITAHGAFDAPFITTDASGLQSPVTVSGNYDIIYFWWTIPTKDECGNVHDSELELLPAEETPDEPWQRLDPNDPDAAPTPIIETVEPAHGPTSGGTPVVIKGSGFGRNATVEIGGNPATSVVVVNQFRIECVSPAHAAGATTVVVTNADGVSS